MSRKGDWIQTFTGKQFWPLDPKPEEIDIVDIAHALSNLCRYGGHCEKFYSVAEHSYWVSKQCSNENKLWGLLHDAAEAYLVDMPKPIKKYLFEYHNIELGLEKAIAERFDLEFPIPMEVKRIDKGILICERNQIMKSPPDDWEVEDIGLEVEIQCYSPDISEWLFLTEFKELYDI